jgi:hypothetical protein
VLSRRPLLVLSLVFGLVASPALAQDKATLKWKFDKDKSFYQTMQTTTKQNMKVMGTEVTQNQTQTFYTKWTPESMDKDGNWTIKQTIVGVEMGIDIGGNKINYDSRKQPEAAGTANPMNDFFKALVGSSFTVTVSPANKVTKVEGRKEFIDRLVKANPTMQPLLDQILTEESLKEMAQPAFAAVPNKEVKKGDEWKETSTLNMGPIGSYVNNYTYSYDGKNTEGSGDEKKWDRIKETISLTYKPPEANAGGNLPFKIKSADLKSTSGTGTILFDTDKGRVEKASRKIDLKGELTIEIGGTSTKVELTQNQETTVTTSDKDPVATEKK